MKITEIDVFQPKLILQSTWDLLGNFQIWFFFGLHQASSDPLVARKLLKIISLIDFCFVCYFPPFDFTSGGDAYPVMLFSILV